MEEVDKLHMSAEDILTIKHNLKSITKRAKKLKSKMDSKNKQGDEFDCRQHVINESYKYILDLANRFKDDNDTSNDKQIHSDVYRKYLLEHAGNFEE